MRPSAPRLTLLANLTLEPLLQRFHQRLVNTPQTRYRIPIFLTMLRDIEMQGRFLTTLLGWTIHSFAHRLDVLLMVPTSRIFLLFFRIKVQRFRLDFRINLLRSIIQFFCIGSQGMLRVTDVVQPSDILRSRVYEQTLPQLPVGKLVSKLQFRLLVLFAHSSIRRHKGIQN